MAAWDRQDKEPSKAHHYFTIYRDLGPQERSLPKVSQISSVSVPRLKVLSEQYGWVERCDQWDAHVQHTIDRAFLTEAAKRARKRVDAFSDLLDKATTSLECVDPEKATLKDVAAAMKTACEGLRLEEGLATAHHTIEVANARAAVSHLPAEIRSGLLRLFEADFAGGAGESDLRALEGCGAGGDEE